MILNGKGDGDKVSSPSLVKQGELEQREGTSGRWTSCHVELTPCELRLYSLDSSGNRHLCTAYSLSHCQGVAAPLPQDARVLQALFFNSTRLQLRASCQWEALDWRRTLWERVLAARPARQRGEEPTQQPQAADPAPAPPPARAPPPLTRPTALPLFTQRCREVLKAGLLHQLTDLNNWRAFTFVLTATRLRPSPRRRGPVTEPCCATRWRPAWRCSGTGRGRRRGRGGGGAQCRLQVVFPSEVLRLRAESEREARDWAERPCRRPRRPSGPGTAVTAGRRRPRRGDAEPAHPRTAPARRPARQAPVRHHQLPGHPHSPGRGEGPDHSELPVCRVPEASGAVPGKAKVCRYSGWYYCHSCHDDDLFLIPARLVHNWDTTRHKVSKQAKEFLEFVYEEPLLDVQQLNPSLYQHCEAGHRAASAPEAAVPARIPVQLPPVAA
ncbi:hypothetical protein ANANG_G00054270 [Anguilla anguilla]|uniref:Rubicon Homology domain-containing protein n=1 Tax=Anguilla anguilla TaxID=7936 RepID=A0A9D3S1D7_ANGAN|nr:hypothetical protein ANANG_G00054270 [Anguilla anguilla]